MVTKSKKNKYARYPSNKKRSSKSNTAESANCVHPSTEETMLTLRSSKKPREANNTLKSDAVVKNVKIILTPKKESFNRNNSSPTAKEFLNRSKEEVLCRSTEYKMIRDRIEAFVEYGASTLLYVTGVPGSGKTYTVQKVLNDMSCEYASVNCAALKKKTDIYTEISQKMPCYKGKGLTGLRSHICSCNKPHIILIDEVDFLKTSSESLLYNLFELSFANLGSVFLLAISNTLGSVSSRLGSRIGDNRIDFRPYTSEELSTILKAAVSGKKLQEKHSDKAVETVKGVVLRSKLVKPTVKESKLPSSKVDSKVIELISKRVASATGDVRKAFEILERSKSLTVHKTNEVIRDISRPLLSPFVESLGFYQKLMLYLNRTASKNILEWFQDVRKFCNLKDFPPIDYASFTGCLQDLSLSGLFTISGVVAKSSFQKEELDMAMKLDATFKRFA